MLKDQHESRGEDTNVGEVHPRVLVRPAGFTEKIRIRSSSRPAGAECVSARRGGEGGQLSESAAASSSSAAGVESRRRRTRRDEGNASVWRITPTPILRFSCPLTRQRLKMEQYENGLQRGTSPYVRCVAKTNLDLSSSSGNVLMKVPASLWFLCNVLKILGHPGPGAPGGLQ